MYGFFIEIEWRDTVFQALQRCHTISGALCQSLRIAVLSTKGRRIQPEGFQHTIREALGLYIGSSRIVCGDP